MSGTKALLGGPRGLGVAAMAGCALLWSLAGLFIKLLDWNPFAIACGRSAVAALFILAWIRRPRFTLSGPQVCAALANAATMLLFVYANKATTSANAILLQYGEPVYVAIIGSFALKERPKPEQWVALAFVAFGMGLFFAGAPASGGGSGKDGLLGDAAAATAGLTFALYTIFMRMQKNGSPVESALLSHVLAAAISLAICLFLPAPRIDARSIAAIAALGVLQIGLASVLFSVGIKRVTAMDASLIGVLEPVFNPVWVFLATREAPGPDAFAGGGCIIAAVLGSTLLSLRREAREATRIRAKAESRSDT
jgi:drug/metabolite transporter (DMT)-like permease